MQTLERKIQMLEGVLGTKDLTLWEAGFIEGMVGRLESSKGQVLRLSDGQIMRLDEIYGKHFAAG